MANDYKLFNGDELVNIITASPQFVDAYANAEGYTYELVEHEEDVRQARIDELKQKLADTDYIACKIAEGAATREEYAEIIAQRQLWRNEINELEVSS